MPEIAGDMEGIKRAWLRLRGREAHPSPTMNEPNPSKYHRGDPRAVLLRPPDPEPAPEAPKAAAPAAEPGPGFHTGELGRPYDTARDAQSRALLHVEGLPPGWHVVQILQDQLPSGERWTVQLSHPASHWRVEASARSLNGAKANVRAEAWEVERRRHAATRRDRAQAAMLTASEGDAASRKRAAPDLYYRMERQGERLADRTGYRGNRLLSGPPLPRTVDEWTEADERRRCEAEASGLSRDEGEE